MNEYSDGWNEAIAALIDRLESGHDTLQSMAVQKSVLGHESDYDRLRGKAEGVRLALSYAREMVTR